MVAPTSPALAWWTPTPETLIRLWPNYKAKAALTTIGTVTQWKPFTKWLVYFFFTCFQSVHFQFNLFFVCEQTNRLHHKTLRSVLQQSDHLVFVNCQTIISITIDRLK